MVPLRPPGSRHRRLLAVVLGATLALLVTWFAWHPGSSGSRSWLRGRALSSSTARLEATVPAGTARLEIVRDGRLLERLRFPGGPLAYTDYLLWPITTYRYEIHAFDESGARLADATLELTTPRQVGSFPRLYSATSFWNLPIGRDPVLDPLSATIRSRALAAYSSSASLVTSDRWGRPLAYANPLTTAYAVGCTKYDCGTSVVFRIPAYAQPSTGSDHHLVVIDPFANEELDMWLANQDPGTNIWSAGSRYLTDPNGWGAMCTAGSPCHGAVAAGLAAFGGIVRPEEIVQGHIDHALFFADPYTRRGYVACPATYTDGISDDPGAIPEGARIQLDPTFDIDAQPWPRWERIVAHALQTYGAYVGDTGGTLGFVAEASLDRGYDAWSLAGVAGRASLANLPWNRFRVLLLRRC